MKESLMIVVCLLLAALLAFSDRFKSDSTDKDFVLSAADGGMLEVRLGELAAKCRQATGLRQPGQRKRREIRQGVYEYHDRIS